MYKVGQKIKINGEIWGFLSFKKQEIRVFSLSEKKAQYFKITKAQFEKKYKEGESLFTIDEETVAFYEKEQKEIKSKEALLKNGVKFLGNDGKHYFYLGKKGSRHTFYDSNDNFFNAPISFIKGITSEFDANKKMYPVTTKKEYNALSYEDKCEIAKQEFLRSFSGMDAKVLSFGRILEGEAYYHEVDKYYWLIGMELEIEYTFGKDTKKDFGFYSVYTGNIPGYYPTSFDESYSNNFTNHYCNGLGDHIEIFREVK